MADLTPSASWDDVYQFETTDPIEGGAGGTDNVPHQQLLNRTEYLKERLDLGLQHNAQARSNVVLTGKHSTSTGDFSALVIAASNTLRLEADSTFPFIYSASGGYDENGEVTDVRKVTSNLEVSTAALPNRDFLALVLHQPAGNPELGFCQEDLFYATPFEPTAPTTDTAVWFNTATGISYFGNGGSWVAWRIVVVGRFTKASGSLSIVETFPYREPYYDEETLAGSVKTFAANKAPRGGWLFCDGASVSRNRYRNLFNAIGTTYGSVSGTTFNLPDLRGYFVRSFDSGAGVDAGRAFGSTQNDEFKAHTHDVAINVAASGSGGVINTLTGIGTTSTESSGGTETRPKNVAMGMWIKI